jgi:hydroxyethylthiazole kinase
MIDWNGWEKIAEKNPLIHQITNVVTVGDCANITLACGASPVMAYSLKEVEEMAAQSQALTLNLGTLDEEQIEAMIRAGQAANRHRVPVVLDPVGAGATSYRFQAVRRLLEQVKFAVIRGNLSEIATLCNERSGKGVDSADTRLEERTEAIRGLARETGAVISVSGPVDFVTDGWREARIENGTPLLAKVTGTGCMLTAVTGSALGAGLPAFDAAVIALVAVGLAGDQAERSLGPEEGIGTFRMRFFDRIFFMTNEKVQREGRVRFSKCE